MDPPTLDVTGVTTMAKAHAHLAAITHARVSTRTHVYTPPYTFTDRRHFTHRHHETYTAEGMKTAVVPSVHTRRDTISSSRRRWRCSRGCSRVTAGSFIGIVARHESSRPLVSPASSCILIRTPLASSLALQLLARHTLQSLRMSKHSARATYVQPVRTWFGFESCKRRMENIVLNIWWYFDKWNGTRFTYVLSYNHGKTSISHSYKINYSC